MFLSAPLLSIPFETLPVALAVTGEGLVESATGWAGMGIIFTYSFLIAFVLPGPSEVVLAAPLDLGSTPWPQLGSIMIVSATGKAASDHFGTDRLIECE